MDYKKEYEEMMQRVKELHEAGNFLTKKQMEIICPELAESEDERIRREIIDYLRLVGKGDSDYAQPMIDRWIAYLEKQKEKSMSATEVLARAGLKPYKDGNQWCILAGDNIQEGICGFGDTIDEALYQFLMEILVKQKEQFKPDKCKGCNNVKGCINCVDSEQWAHIEDKDDIAAAAYNYADNFCEKGYNYIEIRDAYKAGAYYMALKQKEQKPEIRVKIPKFRVGDIIQRIHLEKWDSSKKIVSIDECGYNYDLSHLGDTVSGGAIGFAFENEYELVEQKPVDFPATDEEVNEFLETHPKVEVPEKYKTPDFVFSKQEYESYPIISKDTTSVKPAEWSEDIIRKAVKEVGLTQHQIDWFETNVFPPKQEWSEEDEMMLSSIIGTLKYTGGAANMKIDWLKSLRPSWKPSDQ